MFNGRFRKKQTLKSGDNAIAIFKGFGMVFFGL